jgi:hypothetical protein
MYSISGISTGTEDTVAHHLIFNFKSALPANLKIGQHKMSFPFFIILCVLQLKNQMVSKFKFYNGKWSPAKALILPPNIIGPAIRPANIMNMARNNKP